MAFLSFPNLLALWTSKLLSLPPSFSFALSFLQL